MASRPASQPVAHSAAESWIAAELCSIVDEHNYGGQSIISISYWLDEITVFVQLPAGRPMGDR